MKKMLALLLLAMTLLLAACDTGESGSVTPLDRPQTTTPAVSQSQSGETAPEGGFVFDYQGTEIHLHDDFAPILAALGEPTSYTESASCAFVGKDKTYNYGSFVVTTYQVEDRDYVYSFWFVDDSVTTSDGLYIGAPQSQAETACGLETYNGTNAYLQNEGDTRRIVIVTNGIISSIQYTVVLGQ